MVGREFSGRKGCDDKSVIDPFELFPDDQAARKWFESVRWKDGRFCPLCGHDKTIHRANEKPLPYRCSKCKGYFSVKTGTVMHRSKIGIQKWAITLHLMNTSLRGISKLKLHRELGISQKAARQMAQKIRQGWDYAKPNLQTSVEADEIYSGSEESNRHASETLRPGPGTRGEATHIEGMECDGDVGVDHVPHSIADTGCVGVEVIVEDQANKHSEGKYVEVMEYTDGIDSFGAPMNRGYVGTYHEISPKHLHRYVPEFAGTHNAKRLDAINQMERIAKSLEGKQISYADLIAGNGLDAETVQ